MDFRGSRFLTSECYSAPYTRWLKNWYFLWDPELEKVLQQVPAALPVGQYDPADPKNMRCQQQTVVVLGVFSSTPISESQKLWSKPLLSSATTILSHKNSF